MEAIVILFMVIMQHLGEHTIATTDYIKPYSSALHKNNFYGVQFHPEKSAEAGEQILKNFMSCRLLHVQLKVNMNIKNTILTKNKLIGLQIIPAIDIIDGKCVRLTQGDYTQKKIYNENPLEVAKNLKMPD